jgi:hypothetical protein
LSSVAKDFQGTVSGLQALYAEHRGNVSDKWSAYLEVYEALFDGLRDSSVRLLEVGVQNGGSLEIWAKYFPKAALVLGCDIDELCGDLRFSDPRIQVIVGDATQDDVVREISNSSSSFDVIIDDGSHRSSDIIGTFARLLPLVSAGGIYIIEDLHCSYWDEWGGGLNRPLTAMQFFSRIADGLNLQAWGGTEDLAEYLSPFIDDDSVGEFLSAVRSVQQVSFYPSMCVIHVGGRGRHADVGPRVIAGVQAPVVAETPTLRGTSIGVMTPDGQLRYQDSLEVLSERDGLLVERDGLLVERDGLVSERDWWWVQFHHLRSRRLVRMALRIAALYGRLAGRWRRTPWQGMS